MKSDESLKEKDQNNQEKLHPVKTKVPVFVLALFEICSDPNTQHIVHWIKNGTAFKIVSRQDLEEYVLPKYFNTNNFTSFQRQLNMYDFHKKSRSSQEIIFQNDNFKMGRPDLLSKIKRQTNHME
jgi:heat shock transcription factor